MPAWTFSTDAVRFSDLAHPDNDAFRHGLLAGMRRIKLHTVFADKFDNSTRDVVRNWEADLLSFLEALEERDALRRQLRELQDHLCEQCSQRLRHLDDSARSSGPRQM
ncbi:hypothetical protein AURDEDRAFT_167555 [Auricularia subglabra TFB-10046 SS5]|nr:hypothetical protein AURDEDRAFT_167555 [Auricularia subglabra TFB-10046 SS5]